MAKRGPKPKSGKRTTVRWDLDIYSYLATLAGADRTLSEVANEQMRNSAPELKNAEK